MALKRGNALSAEKFKSITSIAQGASVSPFDWYIGVVDFLILVGVWLELWYMLEKRRRAQIKRTVTKMLHSLGN